MLRTLITAGFVMVSALSVSAQQQNVQEGLPQELVDQLAQDLAEIYAEQPTVTVEAGQPTVSVEVEQSATAQDAEAEGYIVPEQDVGEPEVSVMQADPVITITQAGEPTVTVTQAGNDEGFLQRQFATLIERAAALKIAYADNEYMEVSGFSIEMSLTGPNLGFTFTFK